MQTEAMAGKYQLLFFTPEVILSRRRDLLFQDTDNYSPSPYAGGVQVGSPEPPFKINDIHSMHVVDLLVYTHLLALIHINYETEIDIDNVCKMFLQKHPKRMENSSELFL